MTLVNETFSTQSVFYHNLKTDKYFLKKAKIRVKGYPHDSNGWEKVLGELEIDISQYVGAENIVKQFPIVSKTAGGQITIQISIIRDQTDNSKAVDSNSDEEEKKLTKKAVVIPKVTQKQA